MKQAGLWFLAAWLIIQGLQVVFKFSLPGEAKLLPVINLLAGVCLFLYAVKLKRGDIGLFLLGCWAVLQNILFLFHLTFHYSAMVVSILGIVAGCFLIIGL